MASAYARIDRLPVPLHRLRPTLRDEDPFRVMFPEEGHGRRISQPGCLFIQLEGLARVVRNPFPVLVTEPEPGHGVRTPQRGGLLEPLDGELRTLW